MVEYQQKCQTDRSITGKRHQRRIPIYLKKLTNRRELLFDKELDPSEDYT